MTKSFTEITGVFADATGCGIKPGRDDLSYIYLPEGRSCAGVFTRNLSAAACVEYSREVLAKGRVRGIIINAGNANAATGAQGKRDARATAAHAAALLGCKADEIAVASTGIIGKLLPMEKIRHGLDTLFGRPLAREGARVARAIMTTDLVSKEVFVQRGIGKKEISIGGIAKGSGMIAPNMATMLGFLVTDARVPSGTLRSMLRRAADRTFNMTSVDTDTSTNDMVMVLSTGATVLKSSREYAVFENGLTEACEQLAKMIARDGEGATKLIEVQVRGAGSLKDARAVARQVANSPLVKTAIHGADPNWGRVIAAAGKEPAVDLILTKLDVSFGGIPVLKAGTPLPFDRAQVSAGLKGDTVLVTLDLHRGKAAATAWGCDLTKGYIDINVEYN